MNILLTNVSKPDKILTRHFSGEFGWISEPGGLVRITKYTADRRGYRVNHINKDLQEEKKEKGKKENRILS